MTKNLAQADLAAALGVSQGRVSQLKAEGMPVDSVAAALAWRETHQNVAARKPLPESSAAGVSRSPGGAMDESRTAARTRREIAEASLAEINLAHRRRELILVSAVRNEMARAFAMTRETLLQLPARLAPLLAAETDSARAELLLRTELHHALTSLAGTADAIADLPEGFPSDSNESNP
jgi:phage terminase Nu1 subunit (DNA packaging protein)